MPEAVYLVYIIDSDTHPPLMWTEQNHQTIKSAIRLLYCKINMMVSIISVLNCFLIYLNCILSSEQSKRVEFSRKERLQFLEIKYIKDE